MPPFDGETLPGYRAWLPDRCVTLYRQPDAWSVERLRTLGDTAAHRAFWALLDHLADVFWKSSRAGVKLPCRTWSDFLRAARTLAPRHWPLVRFLNRTVGDTLRRFGLRGDRPLCGLLAMLLEDTVHGRLDQAPLINGALGITIRGAGLTRPRGGMYGFWKRFAAHYRRLGGVLRVGCRVLGIKSTTDGNYLVDTRRGCFPAHQVVCALPASLAAQLGPPAVGEALRPVLRRDAGSLGGAVVVFLGVPEAEVAGQALTHHQLLQSYEQPLGNGNNMFVSVSAPGDTESAPAGWRAVMISTHCDLEEWQGLPEEEYQRRKETVGRQLVEYARRVYPELGRHVAIWQVGTPRTYERFTSRPGGAVGGVRQTLANTNQNALSHDLGIPGFYLVGDSTWPGLGTVACVLGSRIVAELVLNRARRGGARRSRFHGASAAPLPTQEVCHDAAEQR